MGGVDVCTLDFQWTGPGVIATDLFYFAYLACDDFVCENFEAQLLQPYHEALTKELRKQKDCPSTSSYAYPQLLAEFKLSGIDFMRWITAARLGAHTVEKHRKEAGLSEPDVNRGVWCRSIPRLV